MITGTLGIPVTIPPKAPTRLVGASGWSTRLAGVKAILGILVLREPTGGGGTPSSRATEVEVEELSPVVDISFHRGTLITGELKG